tara:strand:+ start:1678 stop:1881 length:204 start_codon:yes stop_codon:yes gene_type:complete
MQGATAREEDDKNQQVLTLCIHPQHFPVLSTTRYAQHPPGLANKMHFMKLAIRFWSCQQVHFLESTP